MKNRVLAFLFCSLIFESNSYANDPCAQLLDAVRKDEFSLVTQFIDLVSGSCHDETLRTPLHVWAEVGGRESIFFELLHQDPKSLEAKDSDGMTPFLIAVVHERSHAIKIMTKLKYPYKPVNVNAQNGNGYSALHLIALSKNSSPFVLMLLNENIDVTLSDRSGRTASMLARQAGHNQLSETLSATEIWEDISLDD